MQRAAKQQWLPVQISQLAGVCVCEEGSCNAWTNIQSEQRSQRVVHDVGNMLLSIWQNIDRGVVAAGGSKWSRQEFNHTHRKLSFKIHFNLLITAFPLPPLRLTPLQRRPCALHTRLSSGRCCDTRHDKDNNSKAMGASCRRRNA